MKRSIRNMLERVGGAGRRDAAAFTLIELLIAVGALAIISVGVATIFEATGRTVQAGRRVSTIASYASLIERRMRDDFASITRDGFLIIRNEYAVANGGVNQGVYPNVLGPGQPNDDAVPLSEADEHPRLRRTDEIMFFVKGQFVSVREMLDPGFVAKSDSAAIYYGHGQRARAPDTSSGINPTDPYFQPSTSGATTTSASQYDKYSRLGYWNLADPPPTGTTNPNRYASDWVLVRRATLLRPPQTGAVPLPTTLPFSLSAQQMADSDIQVSLQPAASNIFRSLASKFPTTNIQTARSPFDSVNPALDSGLVDIATTDLSEIKNIIMTADTGPGTSGGIQAAGPSFFDPAANSGADGNNKGVDGKWRPQGAAPNGDPNIVAREQAWMNDALPSWSMAEGASVDRRHRVRCELAPNNFVGVLIANASSTTTELPGRRADQIMLAGSNFLPHCTEFIVEWSFGVQYTSDPTDSNYDAAKAGQLVWYGMPRVVNGGLVADTYLVPSISPPPLSTPTYPWTTGISMAYLRVDGTQATQPVTEALIHGATFDPTLGAGQPITSYFGYNDPTFNPDKDAPTGSTVPDGKLISPHDSRTPTIPWAWPRFIRVTMSLADPNNPSVEQSFQFVFDVPAQAAQ